MRNTYGIVAHGVVVVREGVAAEWNRSRHQSEVKIYKLLIMTKKVLKKFLIADFFRRTCTKRDRKIWVNFALQDINLGFTPRLPGPKKCMAKLIHRQ